MTPIDRLLTVTLSPEVAADLSSELQSYITSELLFQAISDSTGLSLDELAATTLTRQDIKKHLLDSLVYRQLIEFIPQAVRLDESILPQPDQIAVLDEKVRIKGEIWLIHRYDADPFPSNPHAHHAGTGLKLHLGNGRLYRKREFHSVLARKKLILLRERITKVPLPPLEAEA